MIWFFTPYATDKKYFNAIDAYIQTITDPNDWACIKDGDTMYMYSDFGHKLQEYINRYPDTGLFTCVTNRCHYECQMVNEDLMDVNSIIIHHRVAQSVFKENGYQVKEVNRRVAGHLLMIKKSTWMAIRIEVQRMVKLQQKNILGVDTKISNAILAKGLKIRIMKGFYILHFLRMDKEIRDTKHLI